MRADWALRSGICGSRQLRLFCGELVFEGLPPALFARRHPELIGLTPTVGWINDDVAVVVAHLVGVGRLARVQGMGVDVFTRHSDSVPRGPDRLNTQRRLPSRNPQIWGDFPMRASVH